MPRLENFKVYTNKLDVGDVITNDTIILNDKTWYERFFVGIYDVYNNPPEDRSREFVGQYILNYQSINRDQFIINDIYISTITFFFTDGAITTNFFPYKWVLGELIVMTINSGTGKYLGAKGYVNFDIIEIVEDRLYACGNSQWTANFSFFFTN